MMYLNLNPNEIKVQKETKSLLEYSFNSIIDVYELNNFIEFNDIEYKKPIEVIEVKKDFTNGKKRRRTLF